MGDMNWQTTAMETIANPETTITVSLDGVSGTSTYSQFMSAAQQGLGANPTPFNWEMGQIYAAGRQGSVQFIQGGQIIPNPF